MKEKVDEPLFLKIGPMLNGKEYGDIVPTLIVLAARVLAQAANGDREALRDLVMSFADSLAQEAVEMLERDLSRDPRESLN